jgi:hypothetical protein
MCSVAISGGVRFGVPRCNQREVLPASAGLRSSASTFIVWRGRGSVKAPKEETEALDLRNVIARHYGSHFGTALNLVTGKDREARRRDLGLFHAPRLAATPLADLFALRVVGT